ncbi:hypothetical protein T440DRAFT_460287 [Plenodomus tracheiphilus IPT5]|uniref:Uncharacterized protein n=1 Tax=Plenodomus tracheiphilus IPT5 TaxID=1408161 RepID=A0A6A7AQB0_9PLEO|nr:hypothetical protein T440DRAFT_460287 [Plenodomus tracheiphilus IPT5]
MNQPPRSAEPAPRLNDYHLSSPSADAQDTRKTPEELTKAAIHNTSAFGTLHSDAFGQLCRFANDCSHPYGPNLTLDAQGNPTNNPKAPETTSPFVDTNDSNPRCVVGNYAATSSPGGWDRSARGEIQQLRESPAEPHNMHHRSTSFTPSTLAPMHSSTYPGSRHSSAPPQAAGYSKYDPFRNRFDGSETAKEFRHTSMRFERTPCKPPHEDPTIAEVEGDRRRHVERIYNAMTRGDIARDNEGSTAMKRWVYDANYPSALVEAYAHKVFDAMLEQVKLGFRGWTQNDYVVDERKGEDDDRDVDCTGRLDNIISALEHEKSICENVMSSSNQIRMFVNAPKAYSKRKDQNRVGNGKRPNAKGLVAGSSGSPAKRRRTGGHARNRSSTLSELPSSRGTTPQEPQDISGLPYYTPRLQQGGIVSPPPSITYQSLAPALHPPGSQTQSSSLGHLQGNSRLTSAPSTISPIPRMAPMTPVLPSPLTSSPNQLHSHLLTPVISDAPSSTGNWHHDDIFQRPAQIHIPPPERVDSPLFNGVGDWSLRGLPYAGDLHSANLFTQHPEAGVCLADVETKPSNQDGDTSGHGYFTTFWHQQQGVQEIPFDHPPLNQTH